MKRLVYISVPDFISNTMFPVLAVRELRLFEDEGLNVEVQLLTGFRAADQVATGGIWTYLAQHPAEGRLFEEAMRGSTPRPTSTSIGKSIPNSGRFAGKTFDRRRDTWRQYRHRLKLEGVIGLARFHDTASR